MGGGLSGERQPAKGEGRGRTGWQQGRDQSLGQCPKAGSSFPCQEGGAAWPQLLGRLAEVGGGLRWSSPSPQLWNHLDLLELRDPFGEPSGLCARLLSLTQQE